MDFSLNGNDLQGNVMWADGYINQAAEMNGTQYVNLYVEAADQTGIVPDGSVTVAAWFRPVRTDAHECLVSLYDYGTARQRAWRLDVRPDGTLGMIVSDDGTYRDEMVLTGPMASYDLETWHFAVMVFDAEAAPDAGQMRLYYDGNLIASRFVSWTSIYEAQTRLYVGACQHDTPCWWYSGRIDDVAVYGQAMGDEDVLDLYNYYGSIR